MARCARSQSGEVERIGGDGRLRITAADGTRGA